jgi:hypothetical protein
VLDARTVFDWLPDLSPELWWALPGASYRSDYVRTRIVHRYGGLWLDADVIVMSPLEELVDDLPSQGLVSFGREEGMFGIPLFGALPGSAFLSEWMDAQDQVLRSSPDWSCMAWSALGQSLAGPIARGAQYGNFPMRRIVPIPYYEWPRFLSSTQPPARVLSDSPLTVMLFNSSLGSRLSQVSQADLRTSRILMARLLRIALGISSVEGESDLLTRLNFLSDFRYTSAGRRLMAAARRLR